MNKFVKKLQHILYIYKEKGMLNYKCVQFEISLTLQQCFKGKYHIDGFESLLLPTFIYSYQLYNSSLKKNL